MDRSRLDPCLDFNFFSGGVITHNVYLPFERVALRN